MPGFDPLDTLREAARLSPDNAPLRRHLADSLLAANLAGEAEAAYRAVLALAPADQYAAIGLAEAFYRQGKHQEGLVVLEGLPAEPRLPAGADLLAARLLAATGELDDARARYREAVSRDPKLADLDLAARLGIPAEADAPRGLPATAEDELPADPTVVDGRLRVAWEDVEPLGAVPAERPVVTFADVGGMDEVKEEITVKILLPVKHPELYRAYGKAAGGGILLYGPPGCGKTHLARATAGELGAGFISVGLHEILDMWIGNSERNLHEVFERARRSTPCVLFFDEVDALGASRSDLRSSAGRHVINQFLAELDGPDGGNDGVLVLAATNAPWHVDSAFRRPGRFDQILFVPPPDRAARAAILRILCNGKPMAAVDHDHVADRTKGFSGADLKAVVDRCVEAKLRQAVGAREVRPITERDLLSAAKSVKPSTREWFATARNWAVHANVGGAYDDVLEWIQRHG